MSDPKITALEDAVASLGQRLAQAVTKADLDKFVLDLATVRDKAAQAADAAANAATAAEAAKEAAKASEALSRTKAAEPLFKLDAIEGHLNDKLTELVNAVTTIRGRLETNEAALNAALERITTLEGTIKDALAEKDGLGTRLRRWASRKLNPDK